MADDKLTWPQALADSARRIATPVAQHSVFIIALAYLGSSIAGATEVGATKAWLLAGVLAIFLLVATASIWMAIYKPRHLTFDKDAHREINVTGDKGAEIFDLLDIEKNEDAAE
jgi:hypothetical protein